MLNSVFSALLRVYRGQVGLPLWLRPWFVFQEIKAKITKNRIPYQVYERHCGYPLWVRPCTSDMTVYKLVFVYNEYSCVSNLEGIEFIVDCGGNAGYSSAYLMSKYRNAKCIAIEPDLENYEIMVRNLKPFGDRVKTIYGGIWSHRSYLTTLVNSYRGGHKYAIQVQECDRDSPGAIPAIDILSVLTDSGFNRISLLKVDIEGAEAIVFSEGSEKWLPYVDNIVIELHDDTCFGPASNLVVAKIMEQPRFKVSRFGELHVFKS